MWFFIFSLYLNWYHTWFSRWVVFFSLVFLCSLYGWVNWCKIFYALDRTRSSENAIQKLTHAYITRWNFFCFADREKKKICLVWSHLLNVSTELLFKKKSVWIHIWFWSTTTKLPILTNKQANKQKTRATLSEQRWTAYVVKRLLSSLSHENRIKTNIQRVNVNNFGSNYCSLI